MNVCFVNTTGSQNDNPFRIVPLGSLYLLTILRQRLACSDLKYIDLRGVQQQFALEHVPEADIYCWHVTTPEAEEIAGLVSGLRKWYPRAKHIAGGPHCGLFPNEKIFDSICIGEGEELICRMVEAAAEDRLLPSYQSDAPVNINDYPYPDRSFLPASAIVDHALMSKIHGGIPTTSVLFSRGCPFSCAFCSVQYHGRIQVRHPNLIEEEIVYLKTKYGIKGLVLKDDNGILPDHEQAVATLNSIKRTDIMWRGQCRANGIHAEDVWLARDTGCVELAIALESVWQPSLDAVNKQVNVDKAREFIRVVKSAGIGVKLLFILGLPQEPDDIGQCTKNFIEDVQPDSVVLGVLCPIPGCEIWRNPKKFGMTINHNVPFTKYLFSFGRHRDEEVPHFFDYADRPFGRIVEQHAILQKWLRDGELNF